MWKICRNCFRFGAKTSINFDLTTETSDLLESLLSFTVLRSGPAGWGRIPPSIRLEQNCQVIPGSSVLQQNALRVRHEPVYSTPRTKAAVIRHDDAVGALLQRHWSKWGPGPEPAVRGRRSPVACPPTLPSRFLIERSRSWPHGGLLLEGGLLGPPLA